MNNQPQKRLPELDILRAAAVFLVFGNHLTICPAETNFYLNKVTGFWNRGGWIGVDLFFVLSGFLISGLLFREYQKTNELKLKRFLVRRGFKIYPAFWVLLAATCVAAVFFNINFYRLGLLGEFFFVQNYGAHLWEHTWTLAVEEHFYIGLCVLFWFLLRRKKTSENPFSSIPKIFAAIAVACFALRFLKLFAAPFGYETNIEPTFLRLDSLFFGVFLSYLWHFRNLSANEFLNRRKNFLALAGAILLLPAFVFELDSNHWIAVAGLSMFYLGSGFLLLFMLKTDVSKIPFFKLIAYLGTYSYSIYLWNIPVQRWLTEIAADATGIHDWFFYFAVYLAGTLAFGIGLAKLIEYPFLEARNKLFPAPNQLVVQTAEN